MNDEERLMEIATKKIPYAINQVVMSIIMILLKPGAAATDPFFRKNLGERYFTLPLAMLSVLVWSAISALCLFLSVQIGLGSDRSALISGVGIAIVISYLSLATLNLAAARKRFRRDIRWHSRSKGDSLFGSENKLRDFVIEVLVTIALLYVCFPFAWFFIFSRLQSYLADQLALAQLYNRYLDAIDAEIESKHLEATLRDGFAASQTEGLFQPLPGRFQGEKRANVARVAAGLPSLKGAPGSRPSVGNSPAQPVQTPVASPSEPNPATAAQPEMTKKTFPTKLGIRIIVAIILVGSIAICLAINRKKLQHYFSSNHVQPISTYPTTPPSTPAVRTESRPPPATPIEVAQPDIDSLVESGAKESQATLKNMIEQIKADSLPSMTTNIKTATLVAVASKTTPEIQKETIPFTNDAVKAKLPETQAAKATMPDIKVADWTDGIGTNGEQDFTNALWHCGRELMSYIPKADNGMALPESMRNPFGAITAANPKFFIALYKHPELTEFQKEIRKCDKVTTMTIAMFSSKSKSVSTVFNSKVSTQENATLHKGFDALEDRLKKEGCQTLIDLMDGKRMPPEIRAALGSN